MSKTFGLESDEDLLEFCKTVANGEAGTLTDGSFAPKILWIEPEGGTRLVLMPGNSVNFGDEGNRNGLAWAMKVLSAVMMHDPYLVFLMDSWHVSTMTKTDGTKWGPGEMEYAVVHNTVDAHLVNEAVTITTARNGWVGMASVPYTRPQDGLVEFDWDRATTLLEDPCSDMRASASGDFPEMMREASVTPKIIDEMVNMGVTVDDLGLTPAQIEMHQICAGVKMVMAKTQIPCGIPTRSDEEAEILKGSFGGDPAFGLDVYDLDPERGGYTRTRVSDDTGSE